MLFLIFALKVGAQTCASFSTYFGGTQFDEIKSVCVDVNKNNYIIGNTYSVDLPITMGLISDTALGNYDVFLAKFDSCGSLIWCTYFGTPNFDSGEKIKMTNDGNLVFCGYTSGVNLPVSSGCFQPSNNGGYDCFLTKITPSGTIIWSTYFGKSNGDFAYDVSVDALDNVIIGGTSTSTNLYTTPSSFQPNHKGSTDAFVARFSKVGILKWCTYYGGSGGEDIHALAIDSDYNIIGIGGTFSTNLNTSASAYQAFNEGSPDAYIIKLDSNCVRVFSSYIGGTGLEDAWGVATDVSNTIYLAGHTNSPDFDTTAFAYQTIKQGSLSDWYLTKWSPSGSLLNSTLFGGFNNDLLLRMVFVSPNHLMLLGKTESSNMPIIGTNNQLTLSGGYDGFLTLFDVTSMFPIWSSYYGGSLEEDPLDIVANYSSSIVFVGSTNSTDYPLSVSPYQSTLNNSNDGMMTKLPLPNLTSTHINNFSTNLVSTVSPNPFNDFIYINNIPTVSVEIKNTLGQQVYFEKGNAVVNTSALLPGAYFVTVTQKEFSKTYKLIKN